MQHSIEYKLLADCMEHLPKLAELHYQELARHWDPNITLKQVEERFKRHANRDSLPLTIVALVDDKPIGMASLRITDGILPALSPWLGGLVVDPAYRGKQIPISSLIRSNKMLA